MTCNLYNKDLLYFMDKMYTNENLIIYYWLANGTIEERNKRMGQVERILGYPLFRFNGWNILGREFDFVGIYEDIIKHREDIEALIKLESL